MSLILNTSNAYEKITLDRLLIEGDGIGNNGLIQSSYSNFPSGIQSGAGILIGSFTVPHPKALYIHRIIVSSNKSAWFYCQTGGNLSGGYGLSGVGTWIGNSNLYAITPPSGGSVEIVVNQIASGSFTSAASGAAMSFFIKEVFDTDKTNCRFSICIIGRYLTDDFNLNAEKVILWKGDSISSGTGVTSKIKMLPWKVRQYIFDNYNSGARIITKAYGGSTSKWFDYLRKSSHFDFERIDFIFYQLGVNDASQGTTPSEYYLNIKSEIAYNTIKYPFAKQIYLGSTPRADSYETSLIALRAEMERAVNDARLSGNKNVHFCSLASAVDRTVLANYDLSDGVHINDLGHDSAFNIVKSYINTQKLLAS